MSKSGTKVPEWRKVIAQGGNANSAYQLLAYRIKSIDSSTAAVGYTNPGVSEVLEEFNGVASAPVFPTVLPFPVEVHNKALSRILGKIRSEYEHTNVLPALGEMKSTISQFGTPMAAVLSLCNRHLNKLKLLERGLKGSTVFKRVQWHRIVAATYLEFSFGLAPLIEDTKSVAEALARWNAEKEGDLPRPTNDLITASARADTSSLAFGDTVFPFPGSPNLGFKLHLTQTNQYSIKYTVKLKRSLQAQFGSNERLKQLLGFENPLNFIPTIWEVLPWSWLADYFLNIQQIIEAGVTVTSNVDWIVKSQRTRCTMEGILLAYKPALVANQFPVNWILQAPHLGRYSTEATSFDRSLPVSLGIPVLNLSYPTGVRQFANATAALFARRSQSHPLWLK
jgi:hypothetical protein